MPERLNDYMKVPNPSVWLVLAALFVLIAAVFVWGFTGSLPTTVSTKGVALKNNEEYIGKTEVGCIKHQKSKNL